MDLSKEVLEHYIAMINGECIIVVWRDGIHYFFKNVPFKCCQFLNVLFEKNIIGI